MARESKPAELVPASAPMARLDAQALLSQALQSNAAIETVERLVGLVKDLRAWEARQAWFDALAKFQQQCPAIPKTKHADAGTFSWTYAPLDEVLAIVRPILAPLGLTPRWKAAEFDGRSVSIVCILAHRLGHEEDSGKVVLPIPEQNRGANSMQRAGGAMTYAKRVSLLSILGVQPEDEDDDGGTDRDQPGDYDHEGPPRQNPMGPEAERGPMSDRIARAIERYKLTTEERLAIGHQYLPSGRMNRATVEELRKLEAFLGDAEAVKQWRDERARRHEKPEQGELG